MKVVAERPAMRSVVVMGVAGCGKSTLGEALAARLGWPLIEGDEFHAEASKAKMRAGIALSDADRAGWLEQLAALLAGHPTGCVMTCSALKRKYRDRLRAASPGLRFAWLDLTMEAALARTTQRGAAHLFAPSLVSSQFEALEPPVGEPGVRRLDALEPLPVLLEQVLTWMAADEST